MDKQTNKGVPLTTDDLIRMGHQWEYFSVRLEQSMSADAIDEALNNLGRHRWELVAAIGNLYHFKRKLLP